MLIAIFGNVDSVTLTKLGATNHQLMMTDHPAEAETLRQCVESGIGHVVCKAEWRNLLHPTAKIEPRMNDRTGTIEDCNINGGFTRDARMAERADAIIFGGGVNPKRREMIEHYGGETPVKDVEPPKLSPEEAQAELDKIFSSEPVAEPAPRRSRRKKEEQPEPVAEPVAELEEAPF